MDLFGPGDLRKGLMGPQKARRRNHVLLVAFPILALTVLWITWVGDVSSGHWLVQIRKNFPIASNTSDISRGPMYRWAVQEWVQYPIVSNETEELLGQLRNHAGSECSTVETRTIRVVGLPSAEPGQPVRLTAGTIHKFVIVSLDDRGQQLCEGGDYYETDLTGVKWKSRPPVEDLQNGTYQVQVQVDERFTGSYVFKVILLFSRFHGHELQSQFHRGEEMVSLGIVFHNVDSSLHGKTPSSPAPADLSLCTDRDYDLARWSGRWTRSQNNESCTMNSGGRYQCLPPNTDCELPWCEGPVDRVDSNGWVYSAHCRFKLFTPDEAWQCLDKKWLFSWGDSTSQHTWQNLLAFIMDYDKIEVVDVPRRMDRKLVRPGKYGESLRLTMVYNGHADEEGMFQGLESLSVPHFREYIRGFFITPSEPTHSSPDVIIMNSGLHDAFHYRSPDLFVKEGLAPAINFWREILDAILPRVPQIIYRTSIATAGHARSKEYNPQKVEHYNRLFVDRLQKMDLADFRIVDGFDLTFPWHYDNNYSDGTHYGLKPNLGIPGHQYFVDHMFAHMILNAICLR